MARRARVDAEAVAPQERADERDVSGARAHHRLAHRELRSDVALLVRGSVCRPVGPVRGALADARTLREVARTLSPVRTRLGEAGAALTRDVSLIIRHDKRAA